LKKRTKKRLRFQPGLARSTSANMPLLLGPYIAHATSRATVRMSKFIPNSEPSADLIMWYGRWPDDHMRPEHTLSAEHAPAANWPRGTVHQSLAKILASARVILEAVTGLALKGYVYIERGRPLKRRRSAEKRP
jgi:hypothetical protein